MWLRCRDQFRVIVVGIFGYCVLEFFRRRLFSPEDVDERLPGFLAWEIGPEDGGDVGVVDPFLHYYGADGVDDDNCVTATIYR